MSIALMYNFLGQIPLRQGDNDAAARLFSQGLNVAGRVPDRFPLLISLYDLALSSQAREDLAGPAIEARTSDNDARVPETIPPTASTRPGARVLHTVPGPTGRYLIRSRVRTLPMARSVTCGSPSPWGGSVKRATILVPVG